MSLKTDMKLKKSEMRSLHLFAVSFVVTLSIYILQLLREQLPENFAEKEIAKRDSRSYYLGEYYSRMRGPLHPHDPEVIEMLRISLEPLATLPYNLSTDSEYQNGSHSHNWKFVDEILHVLFANTVGGFFVEAGALDGEFFSNTLWLEQKQHWGGLLVEPEPNNYRDMVYKRRKAWISNTCLSSEPYPLEIEMVSSNEYTNHRVKSMLDRGTTHEVGLHQEDRDHYSGEKSFFKKQCFPLISYLIALNRSTVDFLSLDIQGSELNVFDTIPLDKIKIRVTVIENEWPSFNYDLVKYMNKNGFAILAVGGSSDYIFVLKDDPVIQIYNKTPLQKYIDNGVRIEYDNRHIDHAL